MAGGERHVALKGRQMAANAETQLFAPGSLAPRSGRYRKIDRDEADSAPVRMLRGSPLPSTGTAWQLLSEDRQPPDMQVMTKGWWQLKEERPPVEVLEQEDRNERKQP